MQGRRTWHKPVEIIEQHRIYQETKKKAEEEVPSDWEFTDGDVGTRAGDIVPDPFLVDGHTVLIRFVIIGFILLPFAVGQSPTCHIHKLAFSHLIGDAQESSVLDQALDGCVLLIILGGGHNALELSTQGLYSGKWQSFIFGDVELPPSLFPRGEDEHWNYKG